MSGRSKQARYSMPVMRRARELHAAGWTYRQTQALLLRELGVEPAVKTIEHWCVTSRSNKAAEERRAYQLSWARTKRASKRRPRRDLSPQLKLARMAEMRERGVSLKAIGQVSAVLWGEELSEGQVRGRLEGRAVYNMSRDRDAAA